jgi:dipeptidyl aminopeptidase/acylaminoacyl peptidase
MPEGLGDGTRNATFHLIHYRSRAQLRLPAAVVRSAWIRRDERELPRQLRTRTAYSAAIAADWSHLEVEDLLAAVDEVVKIGVADPGKLGLGGWSYGGILTDYTSASTDRFKGAISGAGMAMPFSFYGVDEYILQYDYELGVPWKSRDLYIRMSYPLLEADKRMHTPTLYMGGTNDFNVPLIGGEQMYRTLRSLHIQTELIVYPGQFHGFTRPSFIKDRYERWLAWYDHYVAGKDVPATPVEKNDKPEAKAAVSAAK